MHVMPVTKDVTYPETAADPEMTVYADRSSVVMCSPGSPRDGLTGVTYGAVLGRWGALQGVIWEDGSVSNVGLGVIRRTAEPEPLTDVEARKHTKRINMWVARFLAETPEFESHPGPDDQALEYRFAGLTKPPGRALYPEIRAEILQVLAERATETTPGAPTVLVEYTPWAGPRRTVPLAVGNQVMKNALSRNCGARARVTAIEDTTRHGVHGTWVTLQDRAGVVYHWTGAEVGRWFVKTD